MRINSISSFNYNQRKSVNFGKFMDDNARRVVREALTSDKDYKQMQYNWYFDRIDKCDYFESYTEKGTEVVKGKFNDEFAKAHTNDKIHLCMKDLEEGQLEDMSIASNVEDIADCIEDIDDYLQGIDPTDAFRSNDNTKPYGRHDSYASMRAEEEAYHG